MTPQQARMAHARKHGPKSPSKGHTYANGNRRQHGSLTRTRFLKALPGTFGLALRLAKKLDVHPNTLRQWLRKPENQDLQPIIQKEKDSITELAEESVTFLIKQNDDLSEKGKNSRWMLERREERFTPRKEITIEGGKNPLVHTNLVDLSTVNLPLDLRKRMLEQIDKKDNPPPPSIRIIIPD